jgi:hypothetical protein
MNGYLGASGLFLLAACGGATSNSPTNDLSSGGTTQTAGGAGGQGLMIDGGAPSSSTTDGGMGGMGGMGGTNTTVVEPCVPYASVHELVQGANAIVAVGESGDAACVRSGAIWGSSDGRNWTQVLGDLPSVISDVAYGNGQFVALGALADGSTGTSAPARLYLSRDATNWSSKDLANGEYVRSFAFGNGMFLLAESQGGGVLRSVDGTTWERTDRPNANRRDGIQFAAGVFAIYSTASDRVEITRDGQSFTEVDATGPGSTGVNRHWFDRIHSVNDEFVAETWFNCCFGETGGPWYGYAASPDGLNWTQKPEKAKVGYPIARIVTPTLCVVSVQGQLESGPTCDTTQARNLTDFYLFAALSANQLQIAGGSTGIIASSDGITWERVLGATQ